MYRKMQVSGLSEIISVTCILSYLGPASCFLISCITPAPSFLVLTVGKQGASDSYCIAGTVLPRRRVGGTSRLRNSQLEAWNRWWLWHSSLLTWQELFQFTYLSLANSLKYCLFNEANLDTLSWIATLLPHLYPAHISLFYSICHTHTQFSYLSSLYCLFSVENVVPQKQGFLSV